MIPDALFDAITDALDASGVEPDDDMLTLITTSVRIFHAELGGGRRIEFLMDSECRCCR